MAEELITLKPFNVGKFYTDGKIIGKGSSSYVCLGVNTETQEKVAIKIIKENSEKKLKKQLKAEIDIMKNLSHPNIVKLYDVCRHPHTQQLCLVMEYCDMGDLERYLCSKPQKRLQEHEAREIFLQIVEGLCYLRSKNIIHRDLKPENLLLNSLSEKKSDSLKSVKKRNNFILKISDFGLARITSTPQALAQTLCGTPLYMSPEIWLRDAYTYKTDLWSLGAILYRMIVGRPLIESPPKSLAALRSANPADQIYQGLSASLRHSVSSELRDLLSRLLQQNPEARINWEDFLAHPFLTSSSLASPSSSSSSSSSSSPRSPLSVNPNAQPSLEPPFPHLYFEDKGTSSPHEIQPLSPPPGKDTDTPPVDPTHHQQSNNNNNNNNNNTHSQLLDEASFYILEGSVLGVENDHHQSHELRPQPQPQPQPHLQQQQQQQQQQQPHLPTQPLTRRYLRVMACARVATQLESSAAFTEALPVYIACLRALRVWVDNNANAKGTVTSSNTLDDNLSPEKIRLVYSHLLQRAERCAATLKQIDSDSDNALNILWRQALALGRDGALDEIQQQYASSAEKYMCGQLILEFVIDELPPSNPHLSTLRHFLSNFTTRLAVVQQHTNTTTTPSFLTSLF